MARLDGKGPTRAEVRTGSGSTPGGKSHSCERQTISVADGRSEAMRTPRTIIQPRIHCAQERLTSMRFLSLLLVAACASSNASRAPGAGSIAIKSVANASAPPVTYSVGSGLVSGSDLDLRLDQGCIRGTMRRAPIQLCSDPANPNHWAGASGDFTAVASPDGKSVKVDGYLLLDSLRELDITQIIPV